MLHIWIPGGPTVNKCTLYTSHKRRLVDLYWSLARYVKLRVTHAPGMPGTFSPPSRISDPDTHHGTCVTHAPWFMSGSLTSGFLWSQWRGKRSQHSWHMRNLQFYVFLRAGDGFYTWHQNTDVYFMAMYKIHPSASKMNCVAVNCHEIECNVIRLFPRWLTILSVKTISMEK